MGNLCAVVTSLRHLFLISAELDDRQRYLEAKEKEINSVTGIYTSIHVYTYCTSVCVLLSCYYASVVHTQRGIPQCVCVQ